jgi:hypothetical protein
MFTKIHKSYKEVIAICDEDLIGKTFEEGEKKIFIRKNFFKDQQMSKQEVIKLIYRYANNDATFNIVGKEAISTAIEAGLINEESTMKIQEIPIALVF